MVVDTVPLGLLLVGNTPFLDNSKKVFRTEISEHLQMSDDEYLICSPDIRGFSFVDKLWCLFKVEHVQEIDFNLEAFRSLLIPKNQKQMVLSLVTVHENEQTDFDDVIKGKGVGMVFLLYGELGTGYTLTAGTFSFLLVSSWNERY
jgi:hypothetical protein